MGAGGAARGAGGTVLLAAPPRPPARSYAQRLELMVLQEEFSPRLSALRASIQILTDAAEGERAAAVGGEGRVPIALTARPPQR